MNNGPELTVKTLDDKMAAGIERCSIRIAALASLQDGWHDGVGLTPTSVAIATARWLLSARPTLAANYYIFPTYEGGILFDFSHAGWDYSIEACPHGTIDICRMQVDGPSDLETESFSDIDDAALRFLDNLMGGSS